MDHHDKDALAKVGRGFFEVMEKAVSDGICPGCASRAVPAAIVRVMSDALESEEHAVEWVASVMEAYGDDADRPRLH